MAPAFDARSVEAYGPMMAETIAEFAGAWRDGEVIDVNQAMADLSLRLISRAMFSGAGEGLGPLMGQTLRRTDAILGDFGLADFLPGLGQARGWLRLRRIRRGFAELDDALMRLIAARRRLPGPGDLLDRLIDGLDPASGQGLNDDQVRDQLVTLFVAGHETTAVAMTWTWWLLAQEPGVEARLRAAIEASPAPPPYARWVVEEAMRLFPPVPRIPMRRAEAADAICGATIPAGTYVIVAPWVLHRHQRLWDAPDAFDPDRFSPERSAGRPRFAYLPFGAGPRICIGAGLAMREAVLILCGLARRWRLVPAGGTPAMTPRMTLRPRGPMWMTLKALTAR
jgi:cytochrome P450